MFNEYELFGDWRDAHQQCCDCCDGYCPWDDIDHGPSYGQSLISIDMDGVEYVTDRHLMIRSDLVILERDPIVAGRTSLAFEVPEVKPQKSLRPLNPVYLQTLSAAGFTVHDGKREQHIYQGGDHVGWVMPIISDYGSADTAFLPTWDDIEELRSIAEDLPVVVNSYPWVTAAKLLIWERKRRAKRGVPVPLLEEEVPSDDGITDAQSRALHASLRGVGIESRESGLEYCSQVVGREVVSTKDLSWRETSRVIEALRQDTRTPADVAEPPLDMGGDA